MSDLSKLGYMYYVKYCDGGTPKLIAFKYKSAAEAWVLRFFLETAPSDSHWIDLMFYGQVDHADPSLNPEVADATPSEDSFK